MPKLRIGILALQGCVEPHEAHFKALGLTCVKVRDSKSLKNLQGLVLPGGESSSILKLIEFFSLEESLKKAFQELPVLGVCAGSILMAQSVLAPTQKSFSLLEMTIVRNSYGRQQDSFQTQIHNYGVFFIRAPRIIWTSKNVETLAQYQGDPIWVQSGSKMATTFHAELNTHTPSPVHKAFALLMKKTTS